MNDKQTFFRLAKMAIKAGLLTDQGRDMIWKRGRKAGYWSRHLLDLTEYVWEQIGEMSNEDIQGSDSLKDLIDELDALEADCEMQEL